MVDISNKINQIEQYIEDEEYFIINRPRQYGKTTTLFLLENDLKKKSDYFVISISFEGLGDLLFQDEARFCKEFLNILKRASEFEDLEIAKFIGCEVDDIGSLSELSVFITKLIKRIDKKVVLMIDEVDKKQ